MAEPIANHLIDEILHHLQLHLHQDRKKSKEQFAQINNKVKTGYAEVYEKLPEALKEAEVVQDFSELAQIIKETGKNGLHKLKDEDAGKLFAHLFVYNKVLNGLGFNSASDFARVPFPTDKWHSAGIGAVIFDSYSVQITDTKSEEGVAQK